MLWTYCIGYVSACALQLTMFSFVWNKLVLLSFCKSFERKLQCRFGTPSIEYIPTRRTSIIAINTKTTMTHHIVCNNLQYMSAGLISLQPKPAFCQRNLYYMLGASVLN